MTCLPVRAPSKWLQLVAVLAVAMCIGSIVVLTLLVPNTASDGYLPIKSPAAGAK